MNVLDVAENSVAAGATLVAITLSIDTAAKRMTLTITDNGKGMPPEMAARVTDPFCTTRKTRKVGLGLPFLKMAAEMTGGALSIESTVGKGTCVTAWFTLGHIDLAPLGDMSATVALWAPGGTAGGGSAYVLPVATATRLGGVKIGSGVSVSADGTISASTSGITQDEVVSAADTDKMLDEIFPAES